MKRFLGGVVVALAGIALGLDAQAGIGTSGAQILQQDTGARPAALAGAYAGFSGDVYCVDVNPAGLNDLTATNIVFMHVGGFEGLSTELLTLAAPIQGLGTVALQALYQGQPPIDNNVADEPAIEVRNLRFGVSYARPLAAGFNLGINAKLVMITLGPVDTSTVAVDLGTQYVVNEKMRLGLALRNLGSPVQVHSTEDPLPLTLVVGGKYDFYNEGQHALAAALDVDYDFPDKNAEVRVAGEYWFRHMLALRLGYLHSQLANVKGMSLGVGFRFKAGRVDVSIDYAFLPEYWETTDFDSESLISLGVRF